MKLNERLILALDIPDEIKIKQLIETLGDTVVFYKVGLIMFAKTGLDLIKFLKDKGKKVFLDLKLYDIPRTVGKAVEVVASMGVDFVTVHGNKTIIEEATNARKGTNLKVFGVTVLTSLDQNDILEMGYECNLSDLVLRRAKYVFEAGCDGVIASPVEIEELRKNYKDKILIVTPGIRDEEEKGSDDQKRTATAFEAIKRGADYLVIGRPIYENTDPKQKAKKIIDDMSRAISDITSSVRPCLRKS